MFDISYFNRKQAMHVCLNGSKKGLANTRRRHFSSAPCFGCTTLSAACTKSCSVGTSSLDIIHYLRTLCRFLNPLLIYTALSEALTQRRLMQIPQQVKHISLNYSKTCFYESRNNSRKGNHSQQRFQVCVAPSPHVNIGNYDQDLKSDRRFCR